MNESREQTPSLGEKNLLHKLKLVKGRLYTIWKEIGFVEEEIHSKTEAITESIMNQLHKVEEQEMKFRDTLIRKIDEAGLKLHHLTTDLKLPFVSEPEGNLTLIELEKFLQHSLVIYQGQVDSRLSSLKILQEQENDLCERLGEDHALLPPDRVPTEESLQYLESFVRSLEKEKDHREKSFRSLKASILAHMEELGIKPSTSTERSLLLGVEDFVTLSQKTLQEMKTMSGNLQLKVQHQKEKEASLKSDIIILWDRLGIEEERRRLFLDELSEITSKNIPKLEEELKTLNELKIQNMGNFINRLRRDIEELWEKCYISEDEKEGFAPYFSENYTEEILELHEKEVQRLKDYYTQNEEIFLRIEKWHMLWKKATELEEKVNDPSRLFGNRGCALLQEEKERKRVRSELPRVEQGIELKMKQWEKENGRPFLVCGQSLTHYIETQWENYNERKNREKQTKQSIRNQQLQREALHGTVLKSTHQQKRHLRSEGTDILRTSKYLRTNESLRTPTSSSVSAFGSTLSRCSSRNNLLTSPKNPWTKRPSRKGLAKEQRPTRSKPQASFNASEISSYDKFTEGIQRLSERENIRSSVAPLNKSKNCFSPRNTKTRGFKGAAKTPTSTPKMSRFASPCESVRRQPLTPTGNRMPLKVASTLPARRRSARLNPSTVCFSASRNVVSPLVRSQRTALGSTKMTTPIRNQLNFLM